MDRLNPFLLTFMVALMSSTHCSSSSPSYTLPIYHREAFMKTKFKDYYSLFLNRVARDEARMASWYKKYSMQDSDTYSTIVTDASGAYVAMIDFGTPPQRAGLLVDTGSNFNWIKCEPCEGCSEVSYPFFDSKMSSTYSEIACESDTCKASRRFSCHAGKCTFLQRYMDQSYSSGVVSYDKVSFGDVEISMISFGCARTVVDNSSDYSGVLGLGNLPISFNSQLHADSFAFCMTTPGNSYGSYLFINHYPPETPDSIIVPISFQSVHYVRFQGIAIDNQMIRVPTSTWVYDRKTGKGGVMVDSGTTFTRFPRGVYMVFRDKFIEKANKEIALYPPQAMFDTCYNVSTSNAAPDNWKTSIPRVSLFFLNPLKPHRMTVDQTMAYVGIPGIYCLAILPTEAEFTIIGNKQLRRAELAYDLKAKTLRITPNACN